VEAELGRGRRSTSCPPGQDYLPRTNLDAGGRRISEPNRPGDMVELRGQAEPGLIRPLLPMHTNSNIYTPTEASALAGASRDRSDRGVLSSECDGDSHKAELSGPSTDTPRGRGAGITSVDSIASPGPPHRNRRGRHRSRRNKSSLENKTNTENKTSSGTQILKGGLG